MNLNMYILSLSMIILCSCSRKKDLYLTRELLPQKGFVNIIVSFNMKSQASVVFLTIAKSEILRDEFVLNRISENRYASNDMAISLEEEKVIIHLDKQEINVHKVERKTKETTLLNIENIISKNFFIWPNQHQITMHDMRKDSICYIYSMPDKEPFEKKRWYFFSIDDEYFLTYNNASNSIARILIKNGDIYETECHKIECRDHKVILESKEKYFQEIK